MRDAPDRHLQRPEGIFKIPNCFQEKPYMGRTLAIMSLLLALILTASCSVEQTSAAGSQSSAEPPVQRSKTTTGPTRTEKDLLGEKQIPADAYYGVQTARALENFQISGIPINHYPGFVEAWAIVKLAAARANTEVGAMKPE